MHLTENHKRQRHMCIKTSPMQNEHLFFNRLGSMKTCRNSWLCYRSQRCCRELFPHICLAAKIMKFIFRVNFLNCVSKNKSHSGTFSSTLLSNDLRPVRINQGGLKNEKKIFLHCFSCNALFGNLL